MTSIPQDKRSAQPKKPRIRKTKLIRSALWEEHLADPERAAKIQEAFAWLRERKEIELWVRDEWPKQRREMLDAEKRREPVLRAEIQAMLDARRQGENR